MALIIGPDPPRQVDWETLGKPAALDGFFRRALAKDANERFASGAELIDAMSALAADSETASPETLEPLDPEKLKMIREEERALELTPTISDVIQGVVVTSEEGFVLSRIDGTSRPRDVLAVSLCLPFIHPRARNLISLRLMHRHRRVYLYSAKEITPRFLPSLPG